METTRKTWSLVPTPPLEASQFHIHISGIWAGQVYIPVEEPADETTEEQAAHNGKGKGRGGSGKRDTGDKNHSLDALAQDGDKGQDKHGVLFQEALNDALAAAGAEGVVDGLGELDAPLVLHLGDAEEGDAHDGDDDGSKEGKGALVVETVLGPGLAADGVEDGNDGGGDDEADEEANEATKPDLSRGES